MKTEPHRTALTEMACFLAGLMAEKCGSRSAVPLRKKEAEPHWRGLMPPPCLLQDSLSRTSRNCTEPHRTAHARTAGSPAKEPTP